MTNDQAGAGNDASFYYYMDAVSNGNVFAEATDNENSYLYRLLFYQHDDLKNLYVEKFKIGVSDGRELVYCKKIAPEMFGQTHYDAMPELVEWLSDSEVLLIVNDRDYIYDLDRMQRVE